jgi:hypothetical protein
VNWLHIEADTGNLTTLRDKPGTIRVWVLKDPSHDHTVTENVGGA